MASINPFTEETFEDLFKHNLKFKNTQNLKYLVQHCSRNENILHLKVVSENEDVDMDQIMMKMMYSENNNKRNIEYDESLKNVFRVQDGNKDVYLGFAKKGILCPDKNNLENLKIILKGLAEFQATYLANLKGKIIKSSDEYKIKNVSDAVVSLEYFKDLENIYTNEIISGFQKSMDELYRNDLLVKSLGSVLANNVFIVAPDKCAFLDLGYEVFRSPVFDALIFIFALSDEYFRQHNLKTLLTLYYESFSDAVKNIDNEIAKKFDLNDFERHVKILLPIVKFETAAHFIQKENNAQEMNHLQELLKNILYSLKYPNVSYEDCLEAVSNKLGTKSFDLVDYQLLSLDQKNGHLGQYFNLKSKVVFSGKIEEFDMFTKILVSHIPILESVVKSGPSKKEQFFFRTLIPLLKEYGLESLVDFVPNCYFDRLNDVIIEDNVASLGYKHFYTNAKIGYDVLKSAFSKIAKLHACTLILEDRMSKNKNTIVRLGDIYKEFMQDWLFQEREGLPKTNVCCVEGKWGLDALIDTFEDIPKSISKEEFHKRADAHFETFLEKANLPAQQFRNVICHGDLYASNILIKYDKNGTAEDCFLVDFQALRYVPVTEDLLMMLYFSTTKDVRDKYSDILLEEYYQELKTILFQFSLDINTFYTPEQFADSVNYMKPVMIMGAIFYGQCIALSQEKRDEILPDAEKYRFYYFENRKELIKYLVSMPDDCTTFLKGLIEDLYDICVINDF